MTSEDERKRYLYLQGFYIQSKELLNELEKRLESLKDLVLEDSKTNSQRQQATGDSDETKNSRPFYE